MKIPDPNAVNIVFGTTMLLGLIAIVILVADTILQMRALLKDAKKAACEDRVDEYAGAE